MGQAVKYAALAAGIAIILALIVVFIGNIAPSGVFGSIASSITNFLNVASTYIQSARGLINYFFGPGSAVAINAIIWIKLLLPILSLPVYITVTIYRWINQ